MTELFVHLTCCWSPTLPASNLCVFSLNFCALSALYIDKPEDISPAEEPPTAEKAPGDEPQSDSGGYMFDQWSRT